MRYYFDTHNGEDVTDDVGIEFDTEDKAFDQALEALASISPEAITNGQNLVSIDVRQGEKIVGSVTMSIDLRRPAEKGRSQNK